MKTILRLASLALLVMGISASAFAVCSTDFPCSTPEVNPGTAMNALALLAGATVIVRNKLKK